MEKPVKKNIEVNYDEIIYKKSFSAFNGYNYSIGAEIIVRVDSDGVLRPGNSKFNGAVPCKIQFYTANDDGKLYKAGEFDKAGRFITREHWSVTAGPSGNPLVLVANTDEPGNGAKLNLRRSRGTFNKPKSVLDGDNIFNISWYAHDGQSYKEVSAITTKIENNVTVGFLPSSLIFKTFDKSSGIPSDSFIINSDKTIELEKLKAINNKDAILLDSPLCLKCFESEIDRDLYLTNPKIGTIIFLESLETIQIFTKSKGWKNLS